MLSAKYFGPYFRGIVNVEGGRIVSLWVGVGSPRCVRSVIFCSTSSPSRLSSRYHSRSSVALSTGCLKTKDYFQLGAVRSYTKDCFQLGAVRSYTKDCFQPGALRSYTKDFFQLGAVRSYTKDCFKLGAVRSYTKDCFQPGALRSYTKDFFQLGAVRSYTKDCFKLGAVRSYTNDNFKLGAVRSYSLCCPPTQPPGECGCPPCVPGGGRRIVPPPDCSPGPIPPNPCCPRFHHGKDSYKKYKGLFFLFFLPLILIQMCNIWGLEHPHKGPCREYEYMRIRTKRYPWGDGVKTFFHNDHVNHLPDECEPPPLICDDD